MKRTIYLVDPDGGGMFQMPGLIVVQHKILREVGSVDIEPEKVKYPGELRVTQAALNLLGEEAVCLAFINHLLGQWWGDDAEARAEADEALKNGWTLYNVNSARGIICITYPDDNTTLICSEEY